MNRWRTSGALVLAAVLLVFGHLLTVCSSVGASSAAPPTADYFYETAEIRAPITSIGPCVVVQAGASHGR